MPGLVCILCSHPKKTNTEFNLDQKPQSIQFPDLWRISFEKLVYFFSTFQLEGGSGCNHDFLEVREGNSTGPLVGRFCGSSLPSNYTSVIGHILWIKFQSDLSISGAGFRATFSHCKYMDVCSHIYIINQIAP